MGAGHGKFSCLVLQQLLEMREFLPSLSEAAAAPWQSGGACDGLPFRYVVTDVAQVQELILVQLQVVFFSKSWFKRKILFVFKYQYVCKACFLQNIKHVFYKACC